MGNNCLVLKCNSCGSTIQLMSQSIRCDNVIHCPVCLVGEIDDIQQQIIDAERRESVFNRAIYEIEVETGAFSRRLTKTSTSSGSN